MWSRVSSLAAEDENEAGWDLPSRQPSQLSELIINSDEIKGQADRLNLLGDRGSLEKKKS
jgi:hypothetical protein